MAKRKLVDGDDKEDLNGEVIELVRNNKVDKDGSQQSMANTNLQSSQDGVPHASDALPTSKSSLIEENILKLTTELIAIGRRAMERECVAQLDEHKKKAAAQVLKWNVEKASLRDRLYAARSAIRLGKTRCDQEVATVLLEKHKVEKKLSVVEQERATAVLALAQQKTQFDKKMTKTLQTHANEIGKAKLDVVGLETQLNAVRDEKSRLDIEHETALSSLVAGQESSLCQICFESRKDTIVLPCLHLHFCFQCLENHSKRSRTCPTCRMAISGELRAHIWD